MTVEHLVTARPEPAFPLPEPASLFNIPQEILDFLPVAAFACGADGRLLWFNKRAAELWGRSPSLGHAAELFSGALQHHVGGRPVSRDEGPLATVLRSRMPVRGAEAEIERPDGTRVRITTHAAPVKDENGAVRGAVGCFPEPVGQPQLEARRLAATYDEAGVGIVEIDAEGRTLRVNKHICHLLGRSEQEILGHSLFALR